MQSAKLTNGKRKRSEELSPAIASSPATSPSAGGASTTKHPGGRPPGKGRKRLDYAKARAVRRTAERASRAPTEMVRPGPSFPAQLFHTLFDTALSRLSQAPDVTPAAIVQLVCQPLVSSPQPTAPAPGSVAPITALALDMNRKATAAARQRKYYAASAAGKSADTQKTAQVARADAFVREREDAALISMDMNAHKDAALVTVGSAPRRKDTSSSLPRVTSESVTAEMTAQAAASACHLSEGVVIAARLRKAAAAARQRRYYASEKGQAAHCRRKYSELLRRKGIPLGDHFFSDPTYATHAWRCRLGRKVWQWRPCQ